MASKTKIKERKGNYTIQYLDDKTYDKLPFKEIKDSLGCANPKTGEAFVRRSGIRAIDMFVTEHEIDELLNKFSGHEDVDGIRYKKGRQWASMLAPLAIGLLTGGTGFALAPWFGSTATGALLGAGAGAGITGSGGGNPWMGALGGALGGAGGAGMGAGAVSGFKGASSGFMNKLGGTLKGAVGMGGGAGSAATGAGSASAFTLPSMKLAGSAPIGLFGPATTMGNVGAGFAPSIASAGAGLTSSLPTAGLMGSQFGAKSPLSEFATKSKLVEPLSLPSQPTTNLGFSQPTSLTPTTMTKINPADYQLAKQPFNLEAAQQAPNLPAQKTSWLGKAVGTAGELLTSKEAIQRMIGGSIPLLGGGLGPQVKDFSALDSSAYRQLAEKLRTGQIAEIPEETKQAIGQQYDDAFEQAEKTLAQRFAALRPGADLQTDSEYQQAFQDLQTEFGTAKANALAGARLQLDQNQSEMLSQMASMDIYTLAFQTGLSVQEAQQFHEMLAQMGYMVATAGQENSLVSWMKQQMGGTV